MNLTICSLNVRGLNEVKKRLEVFNWLKLKEYSICLLQETHLLNSKTTIWSNEWKGKCVFSGNKSSSEGVAILINENLNCEILNYEELLIGRIILLDIKISDDVFSLINI